MKKVLGFDKQPVNFTYNEKVYFLYEGNGTNSCDLCCFNTADDCGVSCNDAKSEMISCYADNGKRFWKD